MSAEIITTIISIASLLVVLGSSMGGMFAWLRRDLQQQFAKVDERFEKVDERFAKIDERFAELRADITELKVTAARIDERLTIVEGRPREFMIATR